MSELLTIIYCLILAYFFAIVLVYTTKPNHLQAINFHRFPQPFEASELTERQNAIRGDINRSLIY